MRGAFVHLEILGPRASAEQWLLAVQEAGVAHVADALHGLEGRPGIGRPVPTEWERAGAVERAEARRSLRALERVLPPSRPPAAEDRPSWIVGFDGGDTPEAVAALTGEAREVAARLGERVVALDAAAAIADRAAARRAALARVAETEGARTEGTVFHLPSGATAAKALVRAFAREGIEASRSTARRGAIVVVLGKGGPAAPEERERLVAHLAESYGAELVPWPGPWEGRPAATLLAEAGAAVAAAEADEAEARAALAREVVDSGSRARHLLDSLDDADARDAVFARAASTDHVVALRVFVPQGEETRLRDALARRHGRDLVVRRLAPSGDAPSHARRLAARPFEALAGWLPSRLEGLSLPVLLAPVMPPVIAFAWGDLGVGLVFLGVGALLALRAEAGSPRRDTALLAQVTGLCGLAGGILFEGAFGRVGEGAFGTGWGLLRGALADADLGLDASRARVGIAVIAVFAAAAALAALASVIAAIRARPGRGMAQALTASTAIVGLGIALAFALAPSPLPGVLLALSAVGTVALTHGGLTLFERTGLDLVGCVRLVAVTVFGLAAMEAVLQPLADAAGFGAVLWALVGLPLLALAVAADAAYAALGVPYDLALGGQRLTSAYTPFTRVPLASREDA